MNRYVFVVGAQRSGTTWLQRLLAAHPAIAGGQESHLFSGYLAPLWQRWQEEEAYRARGGRTIGLGCYLDEAEFIGELRGLAERTLGRVLQAKPGATVVVEKTPDHGLHLPLIQRLFPDAVVLHLMRDGRDVVASLLHAAQTNWGSDWGVKSATEAAQRWATYVRTIRRDLPLFAHTRTLRYEALAARPEEELADLFAFLGVPLPPDEVAAICRRCDFQAAGDSLVVRAEVRGDTLEPAGFQRSGQVGDGRRSLPAPTQAAVLEEAGDLLRELGYDAELPPRRAAPVQGFQSSAAPDALLWKMPRSLAVIDTTNAQMLYRERLFLYATVLALAPERCLEIGVCEGGSSRIIHAALNDLGRGKLVSLDPQLQLPIGLPEQLADRVTFLEGRSPHDLEETRKLADGLFDFVLLDGDHSEWGVRNDLIGLLEVIRPGGIVLAHDAYYAGVEAGIRSVLSEQLPWADGGLISTTRHPGSQGGEAVAFGGFRLLVRTEDNGRRPSRGLVRRLTRKLARGMGIG